MVKRGVSALAMVVVLVAPPSAELKYSSHTQMRSGTSGDQLSAMAGGMMGQLYPVEGVDETVYVGDRGMRVEARQARLGMPAGAVLVTRADGSKFGIDPAAKTFWKVAPAAPDVMASLGAKTDVTLNKTGQFETIDGMRAEKVVITVSMPLPGIDPARLPPGFPAALTATMTAWLTDAIKAPRNVPAEELGVLDRFAAGALTELAKDGRFALKSVTEAFGLVVETTRSDFSTVDVPASMFEVPDGFKEIAAPQARIGGSAGARGLTSPAPSR
jgi:hypothetical protein